ncbi:MAG: HAD family hydrolase [Promethearchaeota archaeon]
MNDTKKFLLFDLDGTLVDTSNLIISSLISVIQPHSKEIESGIMKMYKESPYYVMKRFLGYPDMKAYWRIYEKNLESKVSVYPGIISTLEELGNDHCHLGVVTSLRRSFASRILRLLDSSFEVLVAYEDTSEHKPNPEPILKAIKDTKGKLDCTFKFILYVGDTKKDIIAGRKASIHTGLAGWGLTSEEIRTISQFKPDYILHEPKELLELKTIN